MSTAVQIGPAPRVTPICGEGCRSVGPMKTDRLDRWWLRPLGMALFLGGLTGYAGWAGLQTTNFAVGGYISPLYSPCIAADCGSRANVVLIGSWWHLSPALLVMAVPIGVRATCYYYRNLYYRSFWLSPPACAVAEPRVHYFGETRFPLFLQNVHRYFWAASVLVGLMLTADTVDAFRQPGGIGIGVGTIFIALTSITFWAYLLSCHACRHLVGGSLRSLAGHPLRRRLWNLVSTLNRYHGLFALISLPLVVASDAYIRLVSTGVINDAHISIFR